MMRCNPSPVPGPQPNGTESLVARIAAAAASVVAVVAVVTASACGSPRDVSADAATGAPVVWTATTVWTGDGKVECVRTGDADPLSPGPEVVGVDDRGRVIVVRFPEARAEVVFQHTARLTGLLVADVDPSVAGAEIYAGGHLEGETGGAVFQIVLGGSTPRTRLVYRGDAFVHAMGCAPPAAPGGSPQLVVTDYAAQVRLATPAPGGDVWPARLLHTEPPTDVVEGTEMKDVVVGRIGGRGPRTAFIAVKSGRGIVLDLDDGTVDVALVERGGIARAALDDAGRLWLAGTEGRVLRVDGGPAGWRVTPVFQDVAGLRGVVRGRFPVDGGVAPIAVFGYANACRALRPGSDGAWAATTLFEDEARGHWLAAADLVPGNAGDELALASYAGALRILVPSAAPRADGIRTGARGAGGRR